MNFCKAQYKLKTMSNEIVPFSFMYLLDFDLKNFKTSFVFELRKNFKNKNIFFDQIKLFDKENLYNFDYIPEDGNVFDLFIDEEITDITDEYVDYYSNTWKGEQFGTYLIWCQKRDVLNYVLAYCGANSNIIMLFNESDMKSFLKNSDDRLEFADDFSYLRYVYESGLLTIN